MRPPEGGQERPASSYSAAATAGGQERGLSSLRCCFSPSLAERGNGTGVPGGRPRASHREQFSLARW